MTQLYIGKVTQGEQIIDCVGGRVTASTLPDEAKHIKGLIETISPLNGMDLPTPDVETGWIVRPIAREKVPREFRILQVIGLLVGQGCTVNEVDPMTIEELVGRVGKDAIRGIDINKGQPS